MDAPTEEKGVGAYYERIDPLAGERRKDRLDLAAVARLANYKLDCDSGRGRSHVFRHCIRIWTARVYQQAHAHGLWKKLSQKPELLGPKITEKKVHPGCVTAWTSNASDKTELDRIIRNVEHDRDGASGSLCGERRRGRLGEDQSHLTVHEIRCQLRQLVVLAIGVLHVGMNVIDCNIAHLDVSEFGEAFAYGSDLEPGRSKRAEITDHRRRRLLRARGKRPRDCRA